MKPERDGERPDALRMLRAIPGDTFAALKLAASRQALWRAVFSKAPVAVAGGAGWVVLNLVAGRTVAFGAGALSLGLLQAVRGAGTGLGPFMVAKLPPRSRVAALAPHLSVVVALAGIAMFPLAESAPALLLAVALVWGWAAARTGSCRAPPFSASRRTATLAVSPAWTISARQTST